MSGELPRVEQLLATMGREVFVTDAPEARRVRREQVVREMRRLHAGLVQEKRRTGSVRRRWSWTLAAAVLMLAGAGLAQLGRHASNRRVLPELVTGLRRPEPAPPRALSAGTGAAAAVQPQVVIPPPPSSSPSLEKPRQSSASRARPAPSTAAASSELGPVNQLFAEAKRARREHRDGDALVHLQELLTRYPGSVLAHEASVERFRALARLGRHDEARAHAQRYLARYPGGFAADEARRLLDGSSDP